MDRCQGRCRFVGSGGALAQPRHQRASGPYLSTGRLVVFPRSYSSCHWLPPDSYDAISSERHGCGGTRCRWKQARSLAIWREQSSLVNPSRPRNFDPPSATARAAALAEDASRNSCLQEPQRTRRSRAARPRRRGRAGPGSPSVSARPVGTSGWRGRGRRTPSLVPASSPDSRTARADWRSTGCPGAGSGRTPARSRPGAPAP